jgi:hypothetical protein
VLGVKIVGVSVDGRLFILNTVSGRTVVIDRIFQRELSTRQWRNVGFAVNGNLLYAPTDRGSVLAVDFWRAKKEDEIYINPKDDFFTAPFFHKETLYCVANNGTVYRIVKNAR